MILSYEYVDILGIKSMWQVWSIKFVIKSVETNRFRKMKEDRANTLPFIDWASFTNIDHFNQYG